MRFPEVAHSAPAASSGADGRAVPVRAAAGKRELGVVPRPGHGLSPWHFSLVVCSEGGREEARMGFEGVLPGNLNLKRMPREEVS